MRSRSGFKGFTQGIQTYDHTYTINDNALTLVILTMLELIEVSVYGPCLRFFHRHICNGQHGDRGS